MLLISGGHHLFAPSCYLWYPWISSVRNTIIPKLAIKSSIVLACSALLCSRICSNFIALPTIAMSMPPIKALVCVGRIEDLGRECAFLKSSFQEAIWRDMPGKPVSRAPRRLHALKSSAFRQPSRWWSGSSGKERCLLMLPSVSQWSTDRYSRT